MKIGMMCLWNAANGPSIHAELVGRAWVRSGHQLRVFSAQRHPDARQTLQQDEGFVIRHFSVEEVVPFTRATYFDPSPLLEEAYEVFVAQNVERLPAKRLLEVFPKIKERAIAVQVVHEGKAPEDPLFYEFDWDAIVCFDQRYEDYLIESFPAEIIHQIPYPCHPLRLGDKVEARKKLNLPLDRKIVFSFGFRPKDILPPLPVLQAVNENHPLTHAIVANPDSEIGILQRAKEVYGFIDLRIRPIPLDELYTYLHASDVLLVHRKSSRKYNAVISSTVHQTLGSGCPILFHDSNYVALQGDEIAKYRDFDDMKIKLIDLFQGDFDMRRVEAHLETHNAERIAERFIQLFEETIEDRRRRDDDCSGSLS